MKKIVLLAFLLVLFSMSTIGRLTKPVEASGTITIKADGSIDPPDAPIDTTDMVTYYLTDNINFTTWSCIVIEKDDIVLDGAGYTIQGPGTGDGIELKRASNVTIQGMEITGFTHGIKFNWASNNRISGNTITRSLSSGIWVQASSNNNTIIGNTITNTSIWSGIQVYISSNNTIIGNTIINNPSGGIHFHETSNSIVSGNNITNNGGNGIEMYNSSNNILSGNNIAENYNGLMLRGSSIGGYGCSNNKFCHNNIMNNTPGDNIACIYQFGYTNVWDDGYPSGGNYWSDYNGTDANQDGIGDTSYTIVVENPDEYPLMGPISFFDAGTWNEITYYAHTVSNSTVSDFYFSESEKLIGFNVAGLDDTVGFCRVAIPNEILWCDSSEQWQIWVNNTLIEDRNVIEDNSYVYIYFTYNQSTQNVEVVGVHAIPEFPALASMLLTLTVLTAAIAIYKRRLLKTPIH